MAGHAGRSPPFRLADACLAQRPRRAVHSGGGEGASGSGGARGGGHPEARAAPDPYAAPAVPAGAVSDTAVALPLEGLGPVTLDPVGTADGRWLWEAMVARHHPRGWARPPGVRVHRLASMVLRMAAARVADDREVRHSVSPVVVCTHVGLEHDGYRLHRAGWTCAGHGSGRRLAAGTVPVRPALSAASPGSARVPVRCAVRQSGRSGNVVRAARQQ